jgi:osmoprotectant transport system permease protein
LLIVVWGLGLSVAIAIPLGILVNRVRALELPVMLATGLMYLIPSLALFAFLIPFTGLGTKTAIAAQVVYSLLVIVRNTAAGLRAVPDAVQEAATGTGLTAIQRLWLVEFPTALPVILGGVRVAAVMGVGIASIAAYVGAGGLGTLVFRGIATVDGDLILAGTLPIVALALSIDGVLRMAESRLSR